MSVSEHESAHRVRPSWDAGEEGGLRDSLPPAPTLDRVARICRGRLEGAGARRVVAVASLQSAGPDEVAFWAGADQHVAGETRACALVTAEGVHPLGTTAPALILCRDPFESIDRLARFFEARDRAQYRGVHPTAFVHPSALLASSVNVGPGAVVGPGCVLDRGVTLGANVSLGSRVSVGACSYLHPGVVLHTGVRLGRRCEIGSGTVIGASAPQFEGSADGWFRPASWATVEIGSDVELGPNCVVDRGLRRSTRIHDRVKACALVSVGHDSVIESDVLLSGQVGIANNVVIRRGANLFGQVGVASEAEIGEDAVVCAQSGVWSRVAPRTVVLGSPARERSAQLRARARAGTEAIRRRLSVLEERINQLEGGVR